MKRQFFLLLFISICSLAWGQCGDTSNVHQFVENGKSYEIVKIKKSWLDAASCAVQRGGYLAEINSEVEQLAIFNAISIAGVSSTYVTVANGGGIGYVWIGATDHSKEGNWLWDGNNDGNGTLFWTGEGFNGDTTGTAVANSYNNWGGIWQGNMPNEPDNYGDGQDHAAIGLTGWPFGTVNLGSTGEWNDIIGTTQLYFVIEYDSIVGIEEFEESQIRLFPNPTTGLFHIQGIDIEQVRIFDCQGNLILETQESTIDLSGYSKGMYFAHIQSTEGLQCKKILLQ